MSIQITTSARRVNRYSDFTLTMSLTKNGASYIPPAFIMVFYVDSWDDCCHRYVASCLDGVYTNCKVDKGTISVFFDSPEFNVGQLKCRLLDIVDNANYADGTLDTCTPITLPVDIVAGAGNIDNIVLGYGTTYFGDNHDLEFDGEGTSFGDDNNLII